MTAGNMKKTHKCNPLKNTFGSNGQEFEREVNSTVNQKCSKAKSGKRRKEQEQEDEEIGKSTPH